MPHLSAQSSRIYNCVSCLKLQNFGNYNKKKRYNIFGKYTNTNYLFLSKTVFTLKENTVIKLKIRFWALNHGAKIIWAFTLSQLYFNYLKIKCFCLLFQYLGHCYCTFLNIYLYTYSRINESLLPYFFIR